jgi:Na+-driven multidrug efflux pump
MSVTLKAAGRERLDVSLFAGTVAANIGTSVLLIPVWGGLGCALAKILGGLASGLPRCVALLRMADALGWTQAAAAGHRAARWFGSGR